MRRCFNPRPTLRPGDASTRAAQSILYPVSIRARPCGRAMPDVAEVIRRKVNVSIRARPCGRAMRPPCWRSAADGLVSIRARPCGRAMLSTPRPIWCMRHCFNPRPTLRPGDARPDGRVVRLGQCFNPRPTLRPGDARPRHLVLPGLSVSIRARPCGRAMPVEPRRLSLCWCPVSIRARPCGRAMRTCTRFCFWRVAVSIRARPCGRAMRRR